MSNESKAKRRRSPPPTEIFDPALSQLSGDSLPLGTDCAVFSRSVSERNPNRSYKPVISRKLNFAPEASNMQPPHSQPISLLQEASRDIAPISQSVSDGMMSIFKNVNDKFDELDGFKIHCSEVLDRFSLFPVDEQIKSIKNSDDIGFCRDFLLAERLNNQRLEAKVKLLSNRNHDLESRLHFVETHVEIAQKEALEKLRKEIITAIDRFKIQENNLILAKERESQAVIALTNSNNSLESARVSLESTVKQQEQEIDKLRKEVSSLCSNEKSLTTQRDSLLEKVRGLEKRVTDLSSSLNACDATLQDTKHELRRTVEDLNAEKLENKRMRNETQSVANQYKADALNHRSKLLEEWDTHKNKMAQQHTNEVTRLQTHLSEKERECAEALRRALSAENRLAEMENSREQWKNDLCDHYQRNLMSRYRDMVQGFNSDNKENPLPPRPSSSLMGRERETAHFHRDADPRTTQEPNLGQNEKKEMLTKVISKAVAKMGSTRRK